MTQCWRLLTLVLSLSLLVAPLQVQAAFTRPALWKLDSIDKTYAGTWCFHPGPNPMFPSTCANATLIALLRVHLHNSLGVGLSIAYYDLADTTVLGGAGWSRWRLDGQPVGLCMSGAVSGLDKAFRTMCRFSVVDDDHESPDAHVVECTMPRAQLHVTDGCYVPPAHRGPFSLNDTATAILTILGLLIVLPGMTYSVYRWHRKRRAEQQMRAEGESEVPLEAVGTVAQQNEVRSEHV